MRDAEIALHDGHSCNQKQKTNASSGGAQVITIWIFAQA